MIPQSLGSTLEQRITNLVQLLDGYFSFDAQHLNVNVLDKQTLLDAMDYPELYPQLTIRVSGYAVNFVRLTREQQLEVITRSFHKHL
jgi:formate C-acetyltransferase